MAATLPFMPTSVRLHEGLLFKRGKVNKSWKLRFFVMNRAFKLNYYETKRKSIETFTVNNDRNVLGTIDMLQIEKIEVSSLGSTTFASIPKYIQIAKPNAMEKQNSSNSMQRSYFIDLVTANRTYRLSANDSTSFLNWLECFHKFLYSGLQFESYLDKKGEVNKAFKTRYFTLNQWKHLKYYDTDSRQTMFGIIDLNDPSYELNIEPTDHHCSNNSFIKLTSPPRTYILCAKTAELAQKWITVLSELDKEDEQNTKLETLSEGHNDDDTDEEKDTAIEKPPGEIWKKWLAAQEEIETGRQPMVCVTNGVRLEKVGPRRRHKTTVQDIQMLLDVRCLSPNRLHRYTYGYRDEHFDFTDNEMSDEEDCLEDEADEPSNDPNDCLSDEENPVESIQSEPDDF
eukprot:259550_1